MNQKLARKKCAARRPTELKILWGFEKIEENPQPVAPEEEHSALASLAGSDIDASETYDKLCTVDKDATEYMGKSVH